MMAMLDDESNQRKGFIFIVYNVGLQAMSTMDFELMRISSIMVYCLPARISALHYCFNDEKLRPAMAVAQAVVGTQMRIRFRSHSGKISEFFFFFIWTLSQSGSLVGCDGEC